MIRLHEQEALLKWLAPLPKPEQRNAPFTADCELIPLSEQQTLALSVDAISEEIAMGLYQDPFTMGYIAATASLSDLAACAATPTGLLFCATFAQETSLKFKQHCSAGFRAALVEANTHLLGGDTSSGVATVLSSTGVGLCSGQAKTRMGARVGDVLVLTGQSGIGPALAYAMLLSDDVNERARLEALYRPTRDAALCQLLGQHAHAMIDTSDGILSAITTLCMLNDVGAALNFNAATLHPAALAFCEHRQIPRFALWVAEHGDYQLLAAVPREVLPLFEGMPLHVIGELVEAPTLTLDNKAIDPAWGQLVATTPPEAFARRCNALMKELRARRLP